MAISKRVNNILVGLIIFGFFFLIGSIIYGIANITTPSTGFDKVADYNQEKPSVQYYVYSYEGDKTLQDFKAHIKDVWKTDDTSVFFYYDSNTDVSAIEKYKYTYTMLNKVYANKPDRSFIWYPIQGIQEDAMFYLKTKLDK